MNKDIMSKAVVLSVIFLFIGVGIQPVFAIETKTSIASDELVEIPVQIHGIKGFKSQNIKITQQQYDEFQILKEKFKKELEKPKTMKESVKIYQDMIFSMGELGLIPKDICVELAKRIVTIPFFGLLKLRIPNNNFQSQEIYENNWCQISGDSTETGIGTNGIFWFLVWLFTKYVFLGVVINGWWEPMGGRREPARGWIHTKSKQKEWHYSGSFYGLLGTRGFLGPRFSLVGTEGFMGTLVADYYIGSAIRVKIGTNLP